MTVVGFYLAVPNIDIIGAQGISYLPALVGRIEPIGAYGYDQEFGFSIFEGLGQREGAFAGQVEVVYGLCDVEIGISIKTLDKGISVIPQVALHLKVKVGDIKSIITLVLQAPA